jgi:hypothetical protein
MCEINYMFILINPKGATTTNSPGEPKQIQLQGCGFQVGSLAKRQSKCLLFRNI